CANASIPVIAVTCGGIDVCNSGSIIVKCAAINGPPVLNLYSLSSSVITAHCVTSEPVPAVVGIVVKGGIRFAKGFLPSAASYSNTDASCAISTPIAFAVSIELPPPTATNPSQLFSLYKAEPSATERTGGLGSTLLKRTTSMPADFNDCSTGLVTPAS